MKYQLFLFDLDDTLLDFKASEELSFFRSMESLGVKGDLHKIFELYQKENAALWKLFEEGKTTKEHLKVERFRVVFDAFGVGVDPHLASSRYLDTLPETVVLIDHAEDLCRQLSARGELGIITNGIQNVQMKRIQNSSLAPFIHFVSVSEECGYAKPDVRFFEYTVSKARQFEKPKTIIVGDRFDADIMGAHQFGIDSVWFNPQNKISESHVKPTKEVSRLQDLEEILLG